MEEINALLAQGQLAMGDGVGLAWAWLPVFFFGLYKQSHSEWAEI